MKFVRTWSVWALDSNVFGARVEKVADLDCPEDFDFQVAQTIVCILQSALCNNCKSDSLQGLQSRVCVDCFCCWVFVFFFGHQESDEENKPIVFLHFLGPEDDLLQDKFYICLLSSESA